MVDPSSRALLFRSAFSNDSSSGFERLLPFEDASERGWEPFASHLGAVFGSPGGFPFFSHPLRAEAVGSFDFVCVIFRGGLSTTVLAHRPNDRLTALIDVYVPHDHRLADLSTVSVQSLHLRRESSQQFRGEMDVGFCCFWRLVLP